MSLGADGMATFGAISPRAPLEAFLWPEDPAEQEVFLRLHRQGGRKVPRSAPPGRGGRST
jgi:hypothetical protein